MYKCPGCGAPLRFDPKTQKLGCMYCGRMVDPLDPALAYANESEGQTPVGGTQYDSQTGQQEYAALAYVCPNCGAKLLSTEETAATFCSFCGSNVVLDERLDSEAAPQKIIPFKISSKDCEEEYKKRLARAFFAPSYMKKDSEIAKFRGIYMPYWIYSYSTEGMVQSDGSVSHRVGDYITKTNYTLYQQVSGRFSGISYDASSSFSDTLSEAIAPFKAESAVPFATSYLSGFYADVSDVPSDVYAAESEEVAEDFFVDNVMKDPAYPLHGVERTKVRNRMPVRARLEEKGYFPVWFLSSRTRDNKHINYAVVNGETGKVAADIPVSFGKYLLMSLLAAVPIGLFLWFFIVESSEMSLSPMNLIFLAGIISVVFLFMMNSGLNQAYARENYLHDKGYLRRFGKPAEGAMPFGRKLRYLLKPIIGIACVVIFFLWQPNEDLYYYAGAGVSFLMLILSVLDLVRIHNLRVQQPIPQFNKRGGDENA